MQADLMVLGEGQGLRPLSWSPVQTSSVICRHTRPGGWGGTSVQCLILCPWKFLPWQSLFLNLIISYLNMW